MSHSPIFNWFVMCKPYSLFIVRHTSISVDDVHIFVYIDWVKKEIPDNFCVPMNDVYLFTTLFLDYLSQCHSKPTHFGWIHLALLTLGAIVGFRTWPGGIPVHSMMVIVGEKRPSVWLVTAARLRQTVKMWRHAEVEDGSWKWGKQREEKTSNYLGQYRVQIS